MQNLSRDEAAHRSQLIAVQSYDVSLDLRTASDPDAAGFTTQSIITFTCGEPGAGTFLDFIGGGVHSVMLNGRAQDLDAVVSDGRIALNDLASENQVTVTATGLYSRSGEGMHRFVDPADGKTYLYTQYEPADARRVFANFEQPDLKGRYSFHVIAPNEWTVASNGALAHRTELTSVKGLSRWDFAETEPISTYITTVLAGPYFRAEDEWTRKLADGATLEVPLTVFSRSSLADAFDTDNIFDLTKRGLDFFHDLFGVPYPFGKYDQAFVPEYNLGAMENPGLVTFTEAYIFRSRATDAQYQGRATTLMHEMAHMWFGDLVTMFWWDDLWLKESFADYMGTLAVAEATEWDSAWVSFANGRKAWAYLQDQLPTTHPIVADIKDLEAAKQNFDGITYAKGAAVLKQLVAYVGFDSFIAGARQYFADHAFGNTSLNDLLDALSASSGRDLAEWSRQWLQTSGISTLEAKVEEHDGVMDSVTVVQDAVDPISGQQQPRPHRLKLGCYNFDGGRLIRTDSVDVDISGASTPVTELTGSRRPALLLLNDEDPTYAKVRFDDVSLATISGHLSDVNDVLARALCWSGLWNMARDSVLPAQDYVSAVERHAPAETDVGVTQNLLLNARTAIERYTSAEARDEVRDRHMAAVVEQMQLAPAGSDQQLAWARAAAALGRSTDSHSEYFARLLSADATVEGLVLDPELRWKFQQALAANARTTEALLREELSADNTASGRAGFTSAMAARPSESVKRDAWQQAVHGNELSNELLSATIDGFNQGPRSLIDPYTGSYFDVIEKVWQTKSIELAGRIVRGLFPSGQDHGSAAPACHPVAMKAEAWLQDHGDAPAALRRIVIEQRDHLLRALAAQAKSAALEPAATASRS